MKKGINKLVKQQLLKKQMKKVKGGEDDNKVKYFNEMKEQVRDYSDV